MIDFLRVAIGRASVLQGPDIGKLVCSAAIALVALSSRAPAEEFRIGLPVRCDGAAVPCLVQNLPDMDTGNGIADPFCGSTTYDGHQGTDFRVVSMRDVADSPAVLAVADGIVLRVRDGIDDQIIRTKSQRDALSGQECGNGMVIDHDNGWQTQYCHLKRDSLTVGPGDVVAVGDVIGAIGSSGLAQFPHVHLGVRKNGQTIDPFTAHPITEGCSSEVAAYDGLWTQDARDAMPSVWTQLLAFGVAGDVVDHDTLVEQLPKTATPSDAATVGWAAMINLRQGDRIALELFAPDGSLVVDAFSQPMARSRAAQTLYTGRRKAPVSGLYSLRVRVLRDGQAIVDEMRRIAVP